MDSLNFKQFESKPLNAPSVFSDIQSLNRIREQATNDSRGAIKEAAKEFEAFFMNMMLKSMRQANEVMGEDSLFSSPQEKMFIGMLDEQMSVELSQKGTLGIAELMTRNLLGEKQALNERSIVGKNTALQNIKESGSGRLESKEIDSKLTPSNKLVNSQENKSDAIFTIQPVDSSIKGVVTQELLTENQKIKLEISTAQQEPLKPKAVEAAKKSLFENAGDFIKKLLPVATKIAKKIGVDPKLLVAQAALETGWGKYIMHDSNGASSNNLFGIKSGKSWGGPSVNINTLEMDKGTFVKIKDDFRMYDNFEKSFSDYVDFLQTNPRYQSALEVVKDAKQFVESLQQAGYATDPNYAKKILRIFNKDIDRVHFESTK